MIYLASPFHHENATVRYDRYVWAKAATARMIEQGILVFSPICYSYQFAEIFKTHDDRWNYWRMYDFQMLSRCERLIVLTIEGWDESVGVKAEIQFAHSCGIPVEFMSYPQIINAPREE